MTPSFPDVGDLRALKVEPGIAPGANRDQMRLPKLNDG
jgi:hypothetical protein